MTVLTDTQVVTASGGLVELGYSIGPDTSITATTAATATTLATVTFVADGSPVLIEWNVGVISPPLVASGTINFLLNIDGADVRTYWGAVRNDPQGTFYMDDSLALCHRYTPSAGSHTVVVKAYVGSGTGTVHSGGVYGDALLRVSKIVQATQWPAVTTGSIICTSSTRPASPFAGQQIYETDTSKSLIYNGTAWVSPQAQTVPPMCLLTATTQVIPNTTQTAVLYAATAVDTDATMHSTTVNTDRITINTAGVYLVSAYSLYAGAYLANNFPVGSRVISQIRLNGSEQVRSDFYTSVLGQGLGSTISCLVSCVATDYLTFQTYQASGFSEQITNSRFSAVFVGKTA